MRTFRDAHRAERDSPTTKCARLRTSQLGRELEQDGAGAEVLLSDAYAFEPVVRPTFKAQIAPDARGHKPWTPVPAELALLFANHLGTTDGIVEFAHFVAGAFSADILHRAVEAHRQLVLAGTQQRLHRPAITDKHVFRATDLTAVQPDGRHGIEAVGDQIELFTAE
jgi:hypothetical protein